jgi:hypothetical protein
VSTVWLAVDTLCYPEGGGHLWFYLSWALGLRAVGCKVVWLEPAEPDIPASELRQLLARLRHHLSPYGFADSIAVCSRAPEPLPREATADCIDIGGAADADLLINMAYAGCAEVLARARRTALIDCDTGLLQVWLNQGDLPLPPHDIYFTTGENTGRPGSRVPSAGIEWHYTPYCVSLEHWPVHRAPADAPFTTVTSWYGGGWVVEGDDGYCNNKHDSFVPFFDLPRHTRQPLELALCLARDEQGRLDPEEEEERLDLERRGWRVRHAHEVASTPWDYQQYIRGSRGEFCCAKPSCTRLQNAWLSDRTLCYLASGKPAVVQYTGPSRFLPNAAGIFRFRDLSEAARYVEQAAADYDHQCRLARALAEEYFDAPKVVRRVLERALV